MKNFITRVSSNSPCLFFFIYVIKCVRLIVLVGLSVESYIIFAFIKPFIQEMIEHMKFV